MVVMTYRDVVAFQNNGAPLNAYTLTSNWLPDENGKLYIHDCSERSFKFDIHIGDSVHINIKQYLPDYDGIETFRGHDHVELIVRKFIIEDGWQEETEGIVYNGSKTEPSMRKTFLLREVDYQDANNDGNYWIFFNNYKSKFINPSEYFLVPIGKIKSEEAIKKGYERGYAENWMVKKRNMGVLNIQIIQSEHFERIYESSMRTQYVDKTFGKANSQFPDKDPKLQQQNDVSSGDFFLVLLWSFIPSTTEGKTYLLFAIAASVFVMFFNLRALLWLLIWILYWIKNMESKTSKKF